MQTPLFFLLCLLPAFVLAQHSTDPAADGPYLIYADDGAVTAYWANPEERTRDAAPLAEVPAALFPHFRPDLLHPDGMFARDKQIRFGGVDKLAVVSDMHGQYEVAERLLIANGIIDEAGHWTFGTGHFVVVGDVFDRGPRVTELLWLVHNLQQEARAAGGRVHFLLGNHETMVLSGDLQYINRRYRVTGGLLGRSYEDLYGPDTYLGRWLRSLPLVVKINDMVFVHGGLSRDVIKQTGSLDSINNLYHKYLLGQSKTSATAASERLALLKGRTGPLWYRGYFHDADFTQRDIDRILKLVGAERMVVGHTSFTAISSFFNNRVLAVDSSMKFGSLGEVLLIENDTFYRGTLLGERFELFPSGKK